MVTQGFSRIVPRAAALHCCRFSNGSRIPPRLGAQWSPRESSDFVATHKSGNKQEVGEQIRSMIGHWGGSEVAEFLTWLFGGGDDMLIFPKWPSLVEVPSRLSVSRGASPDPVFNTSQIAALKALLRGALPDSALSPLEIAICGREFLRRRHSSKTGQPGAGFNTWTYKEKLYSRPLGSVFQSVRKDRMLGQWSPDEVVRVLMTETEEPRAASWGPRLSTYGIDYSDIDIKLTPAEATRVVEGLACAGWHPEGIAKFVNQGVIVAGQSDLGPDEVVRMMIAKEYEPREIIAKGDVEFYKALGIELTKAGLDEVVQGLTLNGWEAKDIETFVDEGIAIVN